MRPKFRFLVTVWLLMLLSTPLLRSGDWPPDYVLRKNSESPDARYALIVETADAADKSTSNQADVYLADVKAHSQLGKIDQVDYFEHQNHRDLHAFWASDSKYCVVENDARYGLEFVILLKVNNDHLDQIDLTKRLDDTQKRAFNGYLNCNYRFTPDGKLKIRGLSYTNPKQFEGEPTYYGLLQATFDLKSGKWVSSTAKKIKEDYWDNLETAYNDDFAKHMIVTADDTQVPEDFTGSIFKTQDERLEALDKILNDVYQAVRSTVPANRFSKLRLEEATWVKTRDAAKTAEEKSKLTEDRIRQLQDLLW